MEDNDKIMKANKINTETKLVEPIVRNSNREIAGIRENDLEEVLYFECAKKPAMSTQFEALFKTSIFSPDKEIDIKGGGCIIGVCTLTLPSGKMFRDLSYNGDILGWRRALEASAAEKGLRIGRIEDLKLVISDGEVVALSDCSARFGSK